VVYAVVPRCDPFDGATGFDVVTVDATHEIAESLSDPVAVIGKEPYRPAFMFLNDDYYAYHLAKVDSPGEGEMADLCNDGQDVHVGEWLVPRLWSNEAARRGDPCIPAKSTVYFNARPILRDVQPIDVPVYQRVGLPTTRSVPTIAVTAGDEATIDVQLFSTGTATSGDADGTWKLEALLMHMGREPSTEGPYDLTLDKTEGKSGDLVRLTVKATTAVIGAEDVFILRSTKDGVTNLAAGLIRVQ
jgi:hypothetical protein